MTNERAIGRGSEEDPPHAITARELLQLLQHPDVDLSRPISVKLPYGWSEADFISLNAAGGLYIHLAEFS